MQHIPRSLDVFHPEHNKVKLPMNRHIHLRSILYFAPALLLVSFFTIIPVLSGFYYSLTDWNGLDRSMSFVGFQNFVELFQDREVLTSLMNTVKFTLSAAVFQNMFALFLALLLDRSYKTRGLLRMLFFMPVLLSSLVVGYSWSFLLHPLFGIINNFLTSIGMGFLAQEWLGDPSLALYSVAAMSVWRWTGYSMVIYLAGLQSIPGQLFDAADIDGAGYWKKTSYITIPLLAPAMTINFLISLIGGMKEFDLIYVTTGGGPGYASQTLAVLLYEEAFQTNRMGYGTAIAVMLFLLILLLSLVQLKILRRREVSL